MSQSNKRIYPLSIGDQYNFERVTSSKNREFIRQLVIRDTMTTNAYVDSEVVDCRLFSAKIFHIKNKAAANALHYKILACLDPALGWETLKSETSLAAGLTTYEWDTEPWAYVKIQVKSAVTDTPAKADAVIACQK